MASNRQVWVGNAFGLKEPLIMLGKFETGTAIKRGEILELTADTNSSWCPLDSDFSHSANLAVAAEEVKSGDRMGFYNIIVPRPGDIFEYELLTASAMAVGTSLTYSSSEKLTTGGSHDIGYACGQEHYPVKQGHVTDDASPDMGETIRSTSYVRMMFREAASYFAAFAK